MQLATQNNLAVRLVTAVYAVLVSLFRGRKLGIFILGGKGSGKSRIAGRVIAFLDFIHNIPLVLFDPNGSLINEFIDKLCRYLGEQRRQGMTEEEEQQVWDRIRYCDLSGKDPYSSKWPAIYKLPGESYSDAGSRFIHILETLQPSLADAPVRGTAALIDIGVPTITILLALDLGLTAARSLLTTPKWVNKKMNSRWIVWEKRLKRLKKQYPDDNEVQQSVTFFMHEYQAKTPMERERITGVFLGKLTQLLFDNPSREMHGGTQPSIDWQEVVDKRLCVLLDFRHETNPLKRRFKMLLVFMSFMTFVMSREARPKTPVSLILDEASELYGMDVQHNNSVFGRIMVSLLDQYSRQKNIWVTVLAQHIDQVDLASQKSLLSCGTVAVGQVGDQEQAEQLARKFFAINPHLIKRFSYAMKQVGSVVQTSFMHSRYTPPAKYEKEALNPVEYTSQEQTNMYGWTLRDCKSFQFVTQHPGEREGDINGPVILEDFSDYDDGQWVQESYVALILQQLRLFWKREAEISAVHEAQGRENHRASERTNQRTDEPEPPPEPVILTSQAQTALDTFDQALEAVTQLPVSTWTLLNGDKTHDTDA